MSFRSNLTEFTHGNLPCRTLAILPDNPLIIRRWIEKPAEKGGFGGGPLPFPVVSDYPDGLLARRLGVDGSQGRPERAAFIVSWRGQVRYGFSGPDWMGRPFEEFLRLARAFRHSDLTGEAVGPGWRPGDRPVPTDYDEMLEYYKRHAKDGGQEEEEEERKEEGWRKEVDLKEEKDSGKKEDWKREVDLKEEMDLKKESEQKKDLKKEKDGEQKVKGMEKIDRKEEKEKME